MEELFARTQAREGYRLTVDLETCCLTDENGLEQTFDLDPFRRECLLHGLDDIGLTLQYEPQITAFEQQHNLWR